MTKRLLSTMMLLTSLLGGAKALAANFPKALWFADTQKLYFVYDDVSYGTGDDRVTSYKGKTISDYWDGPQFNNRIYTSDNTIKSNCKYVVIEDNFSSAGMTSCWGMFQNMAALESITGLANMITSSVTSMSNMFNGCTNLASINFDGVNTSNATDMQSIFSGCKTLSSLDLTNFDTGKVTVMDNMFKNCENLTSLTLGSNFKTDKIANMSYMFSNCKKLESLDLTNFNTAIVTNMQDMFSNCLALTSLNVTSFNTSVVTNMSNMFNNCWALPSLDLCSFDVSKVTTMYYMFNSCKELVTIYADSNWKTVATGLTSSSSMFDNCTLLKGKIAWNGNNVTNKNTVEFANPDNGYFTKRAAVIMTFTPSTSQAATVGMDFTEPTLSTNPVEGVSGITYSSSDPTVATVIETTGEVTPLSTGSTTITASYPGNGSTLLSNSASYTLNVTAIKYNAYIGGVQLTTDHINVPGRLAENLGSNLTGGTVSLTAETDYSSPKLTLNGATITNTGTSPLSVSSGGTLALELEGNNQITSTVIPLQNHGSLTISGTGTLTLSGASHGITNYGSITLDGGTLDVTGTKIGYDGTDASSNLTINGGVLMATGSNASLKSIGDITLGSGVAFTQPLGAKWDKSASQYVTDASGHTITSKVTIAKGAVDAELVYSASTGTATYGVAPTGLPTLTNTHSLPITYSSSNTAVATINSEGAVTILHPGTTTITASFDGSATYLAASASYTLTVNKGTPVLTFSATEATATYGTTPNVLSLTVQPEELLSSINYISTIEDKATVGTDKKIQIKKKGLTYIKAIFNGNEYYNAANAQYALTINPATATLQFGNDEVNCKVGETISSQTALTSPGGLTVTYSSNLPSVAGVDETTGKVTASQAGTATITGTVNTDQYYGTKSYQVTITKNANDLAFEKTEVSAAYGDVFTPPTLINPHELGVNYSSSNHSVALVDPISGVVTFKTTGEVDITADFVGNGKYEAGNATYHLTITKKNAALAFAQPTATATYSEAFTEPALTNPNSLTVTYESSEPTVATVATDGKVTVLKTGETTISAKFTGNTLYNASTVSYVLTVNPKTVSSPTITLSATSFTYDGTAKQPTVTVKDGSTTIPASEYTVGYSNNTNVGTATVTITDKTGGNYTVSGSTTFAIAAADGSLTPPVGKTGLVFSGTAQNLITAGSSTTGTVQYSLDGTTYGTAIPQGTDAKEYTIYYKVVAKAGYKDVAPASFKVTISPKTVSSPTITLSATSFTYDGTAKQPTVTVKDGSTTIPASEYTVGYSNNTNVGTATVTITDKAGGNYTVSGTTTFVIVLRGDANGDNKVDVSDIVEMVNAKAGRASAKFKMANADIDNNGTITETDINAVTRIIMGE